MIFSEFVAMEGGLIRGCATIWNADVHATRSTALHRCMIRVFRARSRWTSAVQNAWLASALRQVQLAPPAGYSWTSHSLRSGAASAARAIGISLEVIRYFGHWARNSDTVRDYIDPTFRPSLAASFFFGWLTAMPATDEAE